MSATTVGLFVAAVFVAFVAFLVYEGLARLTQSGKPLLQHKGPMAKWLILLAVMVGLLLAVLVIASAATLSKRGGSSAFAFYGKCYVSKLNLSPANWSALFIIICAASLIAVATAVALYFIGKRYGEDHVLNL